MGNVAAVIANRGYYIKPHVIKKIDGSIEQVDEKYKTPVEVGIEEKYFEPVINGMEGAVKNGTANMAYIPDLDVCGKTGTSENRGVDHSVFIAFAPRDNPQIAIRSEEHTSELQSRGHLVCRLLLENKKGEGD